MLAIEEQNETTARATVSSAVRAIVDAPSGRTAGARRRALERAAEVFRLQASDALGESPQLALLDLPARGHSDVIVLAAWCEAVYVGLKTVLGEHTRASAQ